MTSQAAHLAIRTGSTYTLVRVDADANQCVVYTCPRMRKRYPNAASAIVVGGTGERSIKNAAMDAAGESFRTLKALRASVDADVEVRRAREYDC